MHERGLALPRGLDILRYFRSYVTFLRSLFFTWSFLKLRNSHDLSRLSLNLGVFVRIDSEFYL